MDYLNITVNKLSIDEITNELDHAEHTSLFVERVSAQTDQIKHAEFHCHVEHARKVLRDICDELRGKWPNVTKIAICHRSGPVPNGDVYLVIGTTSKHKLDAINATTWCVNKVKTAMPIVKKEIYDSGTDVDRIVRTVNIDPELVQVCASNAELTQRIERFMEHKRDALNVSNILDFVGQERFNESEYPDSCARVDAVLHRRKDSKSHLKVHRVFNPYGPQTNPLINDHKRKNDDFSAIDERLDNAREHLLMKQPLPKDIYARVKAIEDRILQLESISPEYTQFWKNVPDGGDSRGGCNRRRPVNLFELELKLNQLKRQG